jgi:CrcB protein
MSVGGRKVRVADTPAETRHVAPVDGVTPVAGPASVGPTPFIPTPVGPTPAGPTPAGPMPAGPTPAGPMPAGPMPAGTTPFGMGRRSRSPIPWAVLIMVSIGGMVGALARYGIGVAVPHPASGFPWATFAINVSGCLLIGVLMVLVTDVWPGHRLLRPFLGTGVLGGYTTFSTYIVDVQHLLDAGAARTALAYLLGTVLVALAAVQVGIGLTRLGMSRRHRPDHRPDGHRYDDQRHDDHRPDGHRHDDHRREEAG